MESHHESISESVAPIATSQEDPIISTSGASDSAPEVITTEVTVTENDPIDAAARKLQEANVRTAAFTAKVIEVARESAHDVVENLMSAETYMENLGLASKELAKDAKNLTVYQAMKSKEFLVEKAKSSRDLTLQKTKESKDYLVEKSSEGKQLLVETAEKSKGFAVFEMQEGKKFVTSKWAASRDAISKGSRWALSKTMESYRFAAKKTQESSQWFLHLLTPFLVKSLLLTQTAADKGRDGFEFIGAKAEELEKTLVDMPSDATETMASLSGTPIVTESSSLGDSELKHMSTFYSTLTQETSAQPALGPKVAPVTGTFEEKASIVHQE